MTRWMPAAAAIATLALATSAFAGDGAVSLSKVSGGVLVNQGHGFRPATPGMTLHPGDRVLVTVNGGAALNWSGGCGVSLGAGSIATISNATSCSGVHTAGGASSNAVAKPNFGLPPIPISPIGTLHGLGGGGQSQSP